MILFALFVAAVVAQSWITGQPVLVSYSDGVTIVLNVPGSVGGGSIAMPDGFLVTVTSPDVVSVSHPPGVALPAATRQFSVQIISPAIVQTASLLLGSVGAVVPFNSPSGVLVTFINSFPAGGTLSANIQVAFVSVSGDPHVVGPNGDRFDFVGKPNEVYTMFASKQFVVNARLGYPVENMKFMTEIGVVFGNVAMKFDTWRRDADYLEKLNALLNPLGAFASGDKFVTTLSLCSNHSIVITQMRTVNLSTVQYYLDVAFSVPGCHDDFEGFLGQMYKCKYVGKKFDWDPATEESFRVKTLSSTGAQFTAQTKCYEAHEFGAPFKKTV